MGEILPVSDPGPSSSAPLEPASAGPGRAAGLALREAIARAKATVSNSQPVSRGLAAVLILGYVLQLAIGDAFRGQLSLVPARVIPKFWMLVTGGLVELHIAQVLLDIPLLLLIGNVIEPLWGWIELLKFLVVVNAASFGMLTATYILLYFGSRSFTTASLLYTQLGGFSVSIAGLLVGMKQALPDEEVSLLHSSAPRIRYKSLPPLYLGASFLATAIASDGSIFLMALFGTLSGWFYIRYYQVRPESGVLGDSSEDFRLITLVPEVVQPSLSHLAERASGFLPGSRSRDQGGGDAAGLELGGLSENISDEAQRRRAKGAKSVEDRINRLMAANNDSAV